MVLLRRNDINMWATPDPVAAIVLHAGVANVDTVIVGGNIVKQNGKLTYGDHGDCAQRSAELKRSSERLTQRLILMRRPHKPYANKRTAARV